MAKKCFKKSGAKVSKAGSGFVVKHGTSGKVLARSTTRAGAAAKAKDIRDRNCGSAKRSAKTRKKHG